MNQQKFMDEKFACQGGFSPLSIQYNNYEGVIDYIKNQKAHHLGRDLISELEGSK